MTKGKAATGATSKASTRSRSASTPRAGVRAQGTTRASSASKKTSVGRPKAPLASQKQVPKEKISREATALLWVIASAGALAIGYSGVFGPFGRDFHGAFALLLGVPSFVVLALGAGVGILVLAHRSIGKRRWPFVEVVIFQVLISGVFAVLRLPVKGTLFSSRILEKGGGLVGAVVGAGLARVLGDVGAGIVLSLLGVLVLAALGGARLEGVAQAVARLLRKDRQSTQEMGPDAAETGIPDEEVFVNPPETEEFYEASFEEPDVLASIVEREAVNVSEKHEQGPHSVEGPALLSNGQSSTIEAPSVFWRLPSLNQLSKGSRQKLNKADLLERGNVLQASLGKHGVPVRVSGMTVGPTVTRYELELGEGIKVARILSLHRDIAYAMAATDVRILAPIPGKSAIGVEVPNRTREVVTLGDVMSTSEMARATHPLQVPLGQDISGTTVIANLAEMPHILIAGATGSGKSSALNSILTSILMRSTPEEVRLILVDPKRVELGQYNRLPHLLTSVVVDPKKAANALAWAVKEMDNRYDLLASYGVRDITGFNSLVREQGKGHQEEIFADHESHNESSEIPKVLPFILVVVDELNDLMMVAARDVEDSICRIAQKARAVGIHLIIATQRPSVDVITGVIKANVPSRMAFSVASLADSRVILDQPGAEKLVGRGDMLMITASSSHPRRIQAPWVSEAEVRSVVASWRRQSTPTYVEGVEGSQENSLERGSADPSAEDSLYGQAMRLVVSAQLGSTSMLQRKLKVGFARAGRIMDLLEQSGVVGPSEGSKPREVLMSPEELEELNL